MTDEHDDLIEADTGDAMAADDGSIDEGHQSGDYGLDDGAPESEIDAEALLAEARDDELRMKAYWHLLPKVNFAFLFANCLFFAGALCAWTRMVPPDWLKAAGQPVQELDPSTYIMGLDTIRGTVIFALAMFGFFQITFNIVSRTTKIWPFVLNALIALEVGIGGLSRGFGSDQMDWAREYLKKADSKTMMDDITVPLSAIPPAYWVLTIGGMIVLIVLINGIMSGAKKAKMAAAAAGGEGRRRR